MVGIVTLECSYGSAELIIQEPFQQPPVLPRDFIMRPIAWRFSCYKNEPSRLSGGSNPSYIMTTVYHGNLVPLVILLGVYPVWVFLRGPVRRWKLAREGKCVECGYDLRGNVSGVCPECGKVVTNTP